MDGDDRRHPCGRPVGPRSHLLQRTGDPLRLPSRGAARSGDARRDVRDCDHRCAQMGSARALDPGPRRVRVARVSHVEPGGRGRCHPRLCADAERLRVAGGGRGPDSRGRPASSHSWRPASWRPSRAGRRRGAWRLARASCSDCRRSATRRPPPSASSRVSSCRGADRHAHGSSTWGSPRPPHSWWRSRGLPRLVAQGGRRRARRRRQPNRARDRAHPSREPALQRRSLHGCRRLRGDHRPRHIAGSEAVQDPRPSRRRVRRGGRRRRVPGSPGLGPPGWKRGHDGRLRDAPRARRCTSAARARRHRRDRGSRTVPRPDRLSSARRRTDRRSSIRYRRR